MNSDTLSDASLADTRGIAVAQAPGDLADETGPAAPGAGEGADAAGDAVAGPGGIADEARDAAAGPGDVADEAATAVGGAGSSVNDQILDAVRALMAGAGSDPEGFALGLAKQAMVQAVVIAVQNAVAAQQRNYLLRQAVTASLVRHALEAPPDAALHIIGPHLLCDDIADTLRKLTSLLDEIGAMAKPSPSA
jgi:hypothetical protein